MAEFTVSEVIPACRSFGAGRDGDTFLPVPSTADR